MIWTSVNLDFFMWKFICEKFYFWGLWSIGGMTKEPRKKKARLPWMEAGFADRNMVGVRGFEPPVSTSRT